MPSVGKLIENGRKVVWECDLYQPGHRGDVDLRAILDHHGPAFDLANRRPPCRIPSCLGRAIFKDATSMWPIKLDTITDPRADWAYTEPRNAKLFAMGWRVEMGKYVPPQTAKGPPPVGETGL